MMQLTSLKERNRPKSGIFFSNLRKKTHKNTFSNNFLFGNAHPHKWNVVLTFLSIFAFVGNSARASFTVYFSSQSPKMMRSNSKRFKKYFLPKRNFFSQIVPRRHRMQFWQTRREVSAQSL